MPRTSGTKCLYSKTLTVPSVMRKPNTKTRFKTLGDMLYIPSSILVFKEGAATDLTTVTFEFGKTCHASREPGEDDQEEEESDTATS